MEDVGQTAGIRSQNERVRNEMTSNKFALGLKSRWQG